MRGLAIFLIIMLLATGLAGCAEDDDDDDDDDDQNKNVNLSLGWTVTVFGDNYRVDIIVIGGENAELDQINDLWDNKFILWDNESVIAMVKDPSNETVFLEGDLNEVAFVQADYDSADTSNWTDATSGTQFYADHPDGLDNRTLFVTFMDVDGNDKLSSGDSLWIRSEANGGAAMEDYEITLSNTILDKDWGTLTLPAV